MIKLIAKNKKAFFDYTIEEKIEVGVSLKGTEVKSIRAGNVNLKDSFARVVKGQMYIYNMHISPFDFGNRENHEPRRRRKLLIHKKEILRWDSKVKEKGYSVVPTKIYFKNHLIKLEIGLGKGKKVHDKRQTIKERIQLREINRTLKNKDYS